MTKTLGALLVVLCLSLFSPGAASAFTASPEAEITVDGDGKKKHKKHRKHKRHHKHHGRKHQNNNS